MKWPNFDNTMDKLRLKNAEAAVEGISSDAMAFFSGLVLPGVSDVKCPVSTCSY